MDEFLNEKNSKIIKQLNDKRVIKSIIFFVIAYIFISFTTNVLSETTELSKTTIFLVVLISLFVMRIVVRLFEKIINLIKIKMNDNQEIYVRELNNEYSPAIVSYLYNHKLEFKKDVMAGILNLYSKGYLKITHYDENEIKIEKTDKNAELLSPEELYLYNHIISESNEQFNLLEWENITMQTYEKEKLSVYKTFTNTFVAFQLLGLGFIIVPLMYILITKDYNMGGFETWFNEAIKSGQGIGKYILWYTYIIVINIMPGIFIEMIMVGLNIASQFVYYYTKKGCEEMAKFNKFKKFIRDFTVIKENDVESVIIYEQYLAYAMALNMNKKYTNEILKRIDPDLQITLNKMINYTYSKFLQNFDV